MRIPFQISNPSSTLSSSPSFLIAIIIMIIFTHPPFITPPRATITCNGPLLWGAKNPKKVVEDEFSGHYILATVGPAFVRYKSKSSDFLNLGPTRVGNIRVRFSDRVKKPKMPKRPFFTFLGPPRLIKTISATPYSAFVKSRKWLGMLQDRRARPDDSKSGVKT